MSGMLSDHVDLDKRIRKRAYYSWEADGAPRLFNAIRLG